MCAGADTTIGDKPPAVTNQTAANFTFTSSIAGCTFMCKIDEGAFMSCAASFSTTVGIGTHTITVMAGGDTTPATYTWTVDTTPPDTTATCPAATIDTNEVNIVISSNEQNSTFRCKLDNGAEADCTSPFHAANLSVAQHTVTIVAVDRGGNRDPQPATCTFTVTGVGPNTVVTCPKEHTNNNDVTIEFTTSPVIAGATFTCQLGSAAAGPCTSAKTYNDLPDGEYDFTVFASAGGKDDPSPEECHFAVDTSAPVVDITSPENGANIPTTQTFTFTYSADATSVVCRFNGVGVECPHLGGNGQFTKTGMDPGPVTFSVTATDDAGNEGSDSVTAMVTAGPAVVITFAPIDAAVVPKSGQVNFSLIDPGFTNVKYVCVVTFGTSTNTIDPCTSGIPWTNLPHEAPIRAEVTATDLNTGQVGPTAVRTATVDARPPTPIIVSPVDPVTGPIVSLEFTEEAPFETGPVEWHCEGPQGPFTCAPDVAVPLDPLDDGFYTFTVTGTDIFGNVGRAEVTWEVDATGPPLHFTELPDGEVCPSTEDLGDRIRFALDPDGTPPEKNDPVRFDCSLDEGPLQDCSIGDNEGVFEWRTLQDGDHKLVVIGYDIFDNPGPINDDSPFGVGIVTIFTVDRDVPSPFTITMDNALSAGGTPVTSGDSDINTGARYLIHVTAGDVAHPPPVITAISIDGVACPGTNCAIEPGQPTVDGQGRTNWLYNFSNLHDEQDGGINTHRVTVTVQDQCGTINETTASLDWIVDSTGDDITFTSFDSPFVAAGAAGPQDDITDTFNTVHFDLFDEPSGNFTGELPDAVACAITGATSGPCVQVGGPDTPAVTLHWQDPFTAATEGPHTATVDVTDAVGNTSTGDLDWCVDNTPPILTFDASPNTNGCTTGEGTFPVSLPTNTVTFNVVDDGPQCGNAGFASASCSLFTTDGETTTPVGGQQGIDCTDESFEFTNLPSNPAGQRYRLTVTVVDGVNNSISGSRDFVVDGVAPSVTFVSPGHPTAGADPTTTIFNNIKDNNPTAVTDGTFTTVLDPSDDPPQFTCTIGASAEDCTDLTYVYNNLAETTAGYLVTITGQDCVGNGVPANSSLRFFIDQNPPTNTTVANCGNGTNCALDHTAHSAQIDIEVQDAITNVESIDCLLDFDENDTNPALTAEANVVFQNCTAPQFGLTGLPTLPAGDEISPRSPRTYSGTVTLNELSAGRHRLWYRARDFWGHTQALQFVDFTMDYGQEVPGATRFGHVVAIGHDYVNYNADEGNMLGNAVALPEAFAFTRNLRVVALDLGHADDDGFIPQDASVPVTPTGNVEQAIRDRFGDLGELDVDIVIWRPATTNVAAAELFARLFGADVFLIYDQNDPAASRDLGSAARVATWMDVLRTFVNNGGDIVVLDGIDSDGTTNSNTVSILGFAEGWNSPNPNPISDVTASDVNLLDSFSLGDASFNTVYLVCRSNDPVGNDVGFADSNIFNETDYFSEDNTVMLFQDPKANEVFSTTQALRKCANCDTIPAKRPDPTLPITQFFPVAMDKKFPLRADVGPVRLAGWSNGTQLDERSFAVYSGATGAMEHVCRLLPDGSAGHDLSAGGTVSVASFEFINTKVPGGPSFDAIANLNSVFSTVLFESVLVGDSTRPATGLGGFANAELPLFGTDQSDIRYYATNGCDAHAENGTVFQGNQELPNFNFQNTTTDCVSPTGVMSFLAEARSITTGAVLGYMAIDAPELFGQDGRCGTGNGWCVNAADWPSFGGPQWTVPDGVVTTYAGGSATAGADETIEAILASGDTSFGLGEFSADECFGQTLTDCEYNHLLPGLQNSYFSSRSPNEFADVLRLRAGIYTPFVVPPNGPSGGQLSVTAQLRDLLPGPSGVADQQFQRNTFLSRITSQDVAGTIPRPIVTWPTTTGATVPTAEAGLGFLSYPADTTCVDPNCQGSECSTFSFFGNWTFVVAGNAASVQMPDLSALTGEVACWAPTDNAQAQGIHFVRVDATVSGLFGGDLSARLLREFFFPFYRVFFVDSSILDVTGLEADGQRDAFDTYLCPNVCNTNFGDIAFSKNPFCHAPASLDFRICD